MSSGKLPFILFACVILIMAGVVVSLYMSKHIPLRQSPTAQVVQPQVTPSPTSALSASNSDSQLQQDTQSIDDSMHALDTDVNSVDQSLSDQQTNLQ